MDTDPFKVLQELEQRCRQNAAGLPQQEEVKSIWSGIGFRLGEAHFVAPLSEVVELLNYPTLTKVPGAKSWVRGIANVRGNLLPIMDLRDYLGWRPVEINKSSRVLVFEHDSVFAGLLVDEALGLKHFLEEEWRPEWDVQDEDLQPYLRGGFLEDDIAWTVFSLHALTGAQSFMRAAV
jgi:twitching motility protein PilI